MLQDDLEFFQGPFHFLVQQSTNKFSSDDSAFPITPQIQCHSATIEEDNIFLLAKLDKKSALNTSYMKFLPHKLAVQYMTLEMKYQICF